MPSWSAGAELTETWGNVETRITPQGGYGIMAMKACWNVGANVDLGVMVKNKGPSIIMNRMESQNMGSLG